MLEMDENSDVFKKVVATLPHDFDWDTSTPLGKAYKTAKLERYDLNQIQSMFNETSVSKTVSETFRVESDHMALGAKDAQPFTTAMLEVPPPKTKGEELLDRLKAEGNALNSFKGPWD